MPRKTIPIEQPTTSHEALVKTLANELKNGQDSGQPLVYEQALRTERIRVTVIWDEWDRIPLDERTSVILRAYERAEGQVHRNRIALASGLTVPEATAAEMLPFQVTPALRSGDPVTHEDCRAAMLQEGASTLFGDGIVQLRFATQEEADACRKRLIKRLPKSEAVWLIAREIFVQDRITFEDSADAEV